MSQSSREHGAAALRAVLGFTVQHWRRQTPLLGFIVVTILAATLADIFIPYFSGRLIDALLLASTNKDAAYEQAMVAFGAMVALGAGMVVFRHIGWSAVIPFTLRTMQEVAQETFGRVQRFSTDWHANSFAGSVVRKVTRGMWAFDQLNDTVFVALLPAFVVLFGMTILLGLHWPVMGLVIFVGSVLYLGLNVWLAASYIAPAARLSNKWDTRVGGMLADAIGCNPVVKAFGAEAREDRRLSTTVEKWSRRSARTWTRHTRAGTGQLTLLLVVRSLVIATAIWLWWDGQATPGDVTYVLATYFVVHGYLRDIGMHVHHLQRAVNEMEELVELSAAPLGIADKANARPLVITRGEVEFRRVTFHYGAHTNPLYRDLDVTIKGGERVGLVGHSGSGKTTFVKLIQRLYDVTGGEVLVDGQNVSQATQQSLRSQIAIVQQEPVLFHRSLAENIAYARPGASQAEIETAARLANAHEFITRLPKGYATLVGERGVKLSGGERQRVALARAFLADAPILILDEATSSLDSESEALIQDAMGRLMQGRTAIVIAHRLSTVRSLDRILVFDRGRIVEDGPHESLLARPFGLYRRLFERQNTEMRRSAG